VSVALDVAFARVERTLLSAAFDLVFDSDFEVDEIPTAASTAVQERRFSAA
jgi:hypothetical protein